ncbi:hypothetical protein QYF36_003885 [Acer negundo]|nr:hypothetical protein QYF36_003885 [Acer negundo]
MGVTLLLHKISSSLSTSQSHYSLLKAIQGLPVLELSSICINLTLLLVFLFIISARQIFVCAGRIRTLKDDSVANSSPRRHNANVDGEIRDVKIGTWFKMSLFCCFYVLFVQVLVLGFDGVGLIREAARGKVVDCSVLFMPVAQGLAWFVLSFSALHCKFKVSEKFPFLLRVWWVLSFVICLCNLYVDGKVLLIEGSKHLYSHVVANFAATPALAFLFFIAFSGVTGIEVCRDSDLQEPLLLEEEAGCLKVTSYSDASLFSLATLSWLNQLLSIGAKRPLELKDIPLLAPQNRAKTNYKILNSNWEKLKAENPSKQPSLAWAILKSFGKEAACNAVFAGLNTIVSYVGPYLRPTLSGISMKVERGMRVAVCGMVGSGKSSFLSCILGEIPKISGEVRVCGTAAYVCQSAWIQSGNIEENILFGSPMDKANAVDAHTGSDLFKDYIMTALASKTVVFVTHQVEFLPNADLILVLREGRIIQAGKYDDLLQAGTDFRTLVSAHHDAIEAMDIPNHSSEDSDENLTLDGCVVLDKKCDSAENNIDSLAKEVQDGASASEQKAIKEKKKAKRSRKKQLVQEEERMLRSVFRSPMSFFDSTPAGRILNRVSIDQSVVDLDIPFRLGGFASTTIQLLGIVGVMTKVTWQILLLVVPMAVACLWMQKYYMASSRELVRIVSIQKSPIIHLFGESIAGAATIRGFGQEKRFMKRNLYLLDCFARPFFISIAAIEWLCLRMELLSTFVFAFCMILLVSFPHGAIDPSMAGLAVTYGLNLNARLSRWILSFCKLENKIISIERIYQYSRIPSEAPPFIEDSCPPASWPENGTIELIDLKVRYAENLPVVLHGVTCVFPGGKNIGIVGRTGSGKSTLIQALFRLIEPADGRIIIDNIDISTVGLHDLRSRLSIIPQDPTLFEGTIRCNLDPLEEHSDAEIWEALDKSQLGEIVREKDLKLDTPVLENGDNWSVGQRQLVSLGRALLKQARILVLDEATASVDSATDNLIQKIIRTEFKNCTVCTIAHRIPTVIDSDLVLVLSDGRVAEYDTPGRLLEDKSSMFLKLVTEYSSRSSGIPEF